EMSFLQFQMNAAGRAQMFGSKIRTEPVTRVWVQDDILPELLEVDVFLAVKVDAQRSRLRMRDAAVQAQIRARNRPEPPPQSAIGKFLLKSPIPHAGSGAWNFSGCQ